MKLDIFGPVTAKQGPYASVTLDVTRVDPASSDDVVGRWRNVQRSLEEAGTPDETVEAIGELVMEPTGMGGEWSRVVIATREGVVQDLLVPGRAPDAADWGPVPDLTPAVRGLSGTVPHAVIRVDRSGADIQVTGRVPADESTLTVEGDHDVLTKVAAGGWSQQRYQARAEDSWQHNAGKVAAAVDRLVTKQGLELVLVMGDVRAVAELEDQLGSHTAERLVRLDTGGRSEGISEEAEHAAIEEALAAHRASAEAQVVARFEEQLGRAERAVEGLDSVTAVLQRAQVEELLLVDELDSGGTLWVGERPDHVARTRAAVEELGSREATEVRAGAALVWAAACSDAGVTLLDPGQLAPSDGVAALLRWSDESTPHGNVPSMPGHGE